MMTDHERLTAVTIRQAKLAQIEAKERWYEARANAHVARNGNLETYLSALDDLSEAYRDYKRMGDVVASKDRWF